jgi:hypothetical protein
LKTVEVNGNVVRNLHLPRPWKLQKPLFEAVAKGDRPGIDAALAAGSDILAKNEDGENVLVFLYCGDDIEVEDDDRPGLVRYLIEKGADLYAAGKHGGPVGDYFGDEEEFQKLEALYIARGGRPNTDGPFRVLERKAQNFTAAFRSIDGTPEDWSFDKEEPVGKLPEGAFFPMRTDYGGYKKDVNLRDFHETWHSPLISERFKDLLVAEGVTGVELLPVELRDHKGKPLDARYFLMHPPALECLDDVKSEPQYNHIDPDSINELNQLVIDESKVPESTMVFRIRRINDSSLVLVRKRLAEALEKAGMTGFEFSLPKR